MVNFGPLVAEIVSLVVNFLLFLALDF